MATEPINSRITAVPGLRQTALRYAHIGLASGAGLMLPLGTILGFAFWNRLGTPINESVSTGLIVCAMVGLLLHAMAKCSIVFLVLGLTGMLLLSGMSHWFPMLSSPVLMATILCLALTSLIGLRIAHALYRKLRLRTKSAVEVSTSCASAHELNPRCGTCHIRSLCPYQPGGIADQYTPPADR